MPAGRPSLYDPEKHPPLVEAWRTSNLTDAEIATELGIAYSTFQNWLKADDKPELLGAYKSGRARMLDRCEKGLYNRASGYEYVERSRKVEEIVAARPGTPKHGALMDAQHEREEGEHLYAVTTTTTTKHALPDVGALALVLLNQRKPGYNPDDTEAGWMDVKRVEVTGANGGPVEVDVPSVRGIVASRIAGIANAKEAAEDTRQPE